MKKKAPVYIIGTALFAIPFYTTYVSPSSHNGVNLASFLSVLAGALILILGSGTEQREH